MEIEIHEICPQFKPGLIERIRTETVKDVELNTVKDIIFQGWPASQKELPIVVKDYWNYRDELTLEAGIILKGSRVVIPKTIQEEILDKLHAAHQGTEKNKLRARSAVFWRNINKDIDELTKSCTVCQRHMTKFNFVRKIPPNQSTSKTVVELLKQIFSEHGIPKIIRSDNGPHYAGQAFKEFCQDYQFSHKTSSPHYPRSNGFIESQVKIIKRALMKAKESKLDPYMAILCVNSTPVDSKLPSPGEMLYSRIIQDNLPRKINRDRIADEIIDRLVQRQVLPYY